METNIADIVKGRAKKIADVIGRVPDLVPFPVARGFNLEMLFNRLITSLEVVAHATNRMRHVAQGMPVDSVTLTLAQLPEFPVALPPNSVCRRDYFHRRSNEVTRLILLAKEGTLPRHETKEIPC